MAGPKTGERDELELGRRVRAARSYSGVTQVELAERLGIDPSTLGRYEKGQIDKGYKHDGLLNAAADVTKLPHEFFSISFDDLPLMAKAWRQASRLPSPDDLQRLVDGKLKQGRRPR